MYISATNSISKFIYLSRWCQVLGSVAITMRHSDSKTHGKVTRTESWSSAVGGPDVGQLKTYVTYLPPSSDLYEHASRNMVVGNYVA